MPIAQYKLQLLAVFTALALLTSSVYALMPIAGAFETALSYTLLPGVALYTALNGSTLFGAGFGRIGNYLVIALCSALAWTVLVGIAGYLAVRFRERPQE